MLVDSPEQFARKTYDYVIVGGGTAGLTVAARLTEDPNVTVGVVEAGQNRLADPNILVPGLVFNAIGHADYDWIFNSTPQKSLNGRVVSHPRGKVLGGSSAINGMMCCYSSKADIDNWAKLGNPGWSHDDLAPYYKRFSNFTQPSKDIAKFYHTAEVIEKDLRDGAGPVHTSFAHNERYGSDAWVKTFNKLGLKMPVDPQTGEGNGGYSNLLTVDAASGTRSFAATAYYQPNAVRANLTILTEAQVSKITIAHLDKGELLATGVDFTAFGNPYHVKATREVILSCGSFQSPQILELSGIGSKEILEPLGIPILVENPNVGENLQDHGIVPFCVEAAEGAITFDSLSAPGVAAAALEDFYKERNGLLTAIISSTANMSYPGVLEQLGHDVKAVEKKIDLTTTDSKIPSLQKQYRLMKEALLDPEDSAYQIFYTTVGVEVGFMDGQGTPSPGNWIDIWTNNTHPFSRGSVHAASKDPAVAPIIDPNYLSHPLDVSVISQGVLFAQKLATSEPFASKLRDSGKVFHPGFFHLTEENVGGFCKSAITSEFHPLGSCSMLPRKDGGVVDTKLRVYGVQNLRVVDASIMPLHIRNNLQTTVYAVAEKAADIIKGDWEVVGEKNGKRGGEPVTLNGKRPKRS